MNIFDEMLNGRDIPEECIKPRFFILKHPVPQPDHGMIACKQYHLYYGDPSFMLMLDKLGYENKEERKKNLTKVYMSMSYQKYMKTYQQLLIKTANEYFHGINSTDADSLELLQNIINYKMKQGKQLDVFKLEIFDIMNDDDFKRACA